MGSSMVCFSRGRGDQKRGWLSLSPTEQDTSRGPQDKPGSPGIPQHPMGAFSPQLGQPAASWGNEVSLQQGPLPCSLGKPWSVRSPPTQPSGNPSASCRLGVSLSELQAFLWASILNGLGS